MNILMIVHLYVTQWNHHKLHLRERFDRSSSRQSDFSVEFSTLFSFDKIWILIDMATYAKQSFMWSEHIQKGNVLLMAASFLISAPLLIMYWRADSKSPNDFTSSSAKSSHQASLRLFSRHRWCMRSFLFFAYLNKHSLSSTDRTSSYPHRLPVSRASARGLHKTSNSPFSIFEPMRLNLQAFSSILNFAPLFLCHPSGRCLTHRQRCRIG